MEEKNNASLVFLSDGGEMGELTRAYHWTITPLGPPETWPGSLRTTLGILLHSAFPMFLFWGEDLICFYNDPFRPSLGVDGKHPALGKKGKEVWPEIWDFIGPLIEQVMTTGKPVWFEDQLVPFYRNGKIEDIYWTFSYSPAYGDNGLVSGVVVTCAETTGAVKTRKSLQESEERFRTMAEGSNTLIAVADENGHASYFNEAWTNLTGRPIADLLSLGWTDLVHPEDRDRCLQLYAEALFKKSSFSWEFRVLDKENCYRWLLTQGPARFSADGSFAGHISSSTDITALKDAEDAIRNSEQQVRDLVESASFPIGVYIGRDLRISIANRAMLDAWGRGSEVVGKALREVLPEMIEQSIFEEMDQVYTTGVPFHKENSRVEIGKEGQVRTLYFNYSFIPLRDPIGQVYGVMATGADVTDLNLAKRQLEENEKNMRNTILKAPVAICIFRGPEYAVEIANDRMLELWGVEAAQVMHKPIFAGLPEVQNQGFEALLHSVYHTGKAISIKEHPIVLPRNGKLSDEYVSFLYEPEIGATGAIIGILAVAIIVTEQVQARHQIEELVGERTRELAEANRNLERSNAELSQFAHVASHDLQEPIRKINIYSQLLENRLGTIDPTAKSYLDRIGIAGDRMRLLVRDILAYSEVSESAPAFERVDLNRVMHGVLQEFELLIEQKQAHISVSDLPTLTAIPLQMQQLFANLVSNALKYAKADIPSMISIAADLEGAFWHIRVTDNGIGFAPEHAQQIFSIFQRLHKKTDYSGTGIGLAICQKIAKNHHGQIYAASQPGEGATFHVLLPAS
jgi:PAS domain S-box-containing protein